ncbi:MAG: TrmH family RNA methyltransferase [Chitinophagales bacterium]
MLLKSQFKYIQSLGHKKFRDTENVFVAEGPKIVNELLNESGTPLVTLFAVKEWIVLNPQWVAAHSSRQLIEIAQHELERMSGLSTPNMVLGLFQKPDFGSPEFGKRITLVLDKIQDPGNLGTIIRIADWFGLHQIVCSKESADAFNAKTVQASMGSIARVSVFYEDLLAFLKAHDQIPRYAAVLGGSNLYLLEPLQEAMILIGNESQGLDPELLRICKHQLSIPRKGQAESLNAAIATGIILSHLIK